MQGSSVYYSYKSYEFMKEGKFLNIEDSQQKTFEELQAKIIELESELKKQKEVSDQSAKILKLIWGDGFESDSLH